MDAKLLLLTLCTGVGLGFLLLAVRQLLTVARLWVRGVLVTGTVIPRVAGDPRRSGLVLFTDQVQSACGSACATSGWCPRAHRCSVKHR